MQEDIVSFDAHRITREQRAAVEQLLAKKGTSFEPAVIARSSQAAAPMATWVVANLKYAAVLEKVAPLESQLTKLSDTFAQSQVTLLESLRCCMQCCAASAEHGSLLLSGGSVLQCQ